jgi:hypothetical protein
MSCGEGIDYSIKEPEQCPYCKDSLKANITIPAAVPNKPGKKPLNAADLKNFLDRKKKPARKVVEEPEDEDYDEEDEDNDDEDFDEDDEDPSLARIVIDKKNNPLLDLIEPPQNVKLGERIGSVAQGKAEILPARPIGKKMSKKEIIKQFQAESSSIAVP